MYVLRQQELTIRLFILDFKEEGYEEAEMVILRPLLWNLSGSVRRTFFAGPSVSGENRELAELPQFYTEDTEINVNWLREMGDYFQEHFFMRNEMVTANALVMGKVLGTSSVDNVIQGTDGWLYYKDSLSDYQGTELLSDRSLYNIAHSLSMMKDYLEQKGVQMVFRLELRKWDF